MEGPYESAVTMEEQDTMPYSVVEGYAISSQPSAAPTCLIPSGSEEKQLSSTTVLC